jgi:uncharacterized membrane protein YbhN (UPF0104 family)
VGTVGAFVALGVDATAALAGVLLFRAFVFVAEIPIGGVALAGWLVTRRLARRSGEPAGQPHPADAARLVTGRSSG